MKNKLIAAGIGTLLIGMGSCSKDFKVAAPYKDISFVYGLLNIKDTAHYIRIQKAFLDDTKSAIDMSKDADSSFYSSLNVVVKEFNGTSLVSTTTLDRVDLAAEGYPKENGAFFTSPNYAYKLKKALNTSYQYRLVVNNTGTGQTDSAQIAIIDSAAFKSRDLNAADYKLSFHNASTTPTAKFSIRVQPAANAAVYEGILNFRYVDSNIVTHTTENKIASWTFATATTPVSQFQLETNYSNFKPFFLNTVGTAPENIVRFLDSCEVVLWAGSKELNDYMVLNASQGGITADQIKPIYTNIHSNKPQAAYGLFGSRQRISRVVPLNTISVDSIRIALPTLKILGVYPH